MTLLVLFVFCLELPVATLEGVVRPYCGFLFGSLVCGLGGCGLGGCGGGWVALVWVVILDLCGFWWVCGWYLV